MIVKVESDIDGESRRLGFVTGSVPDSFFDALTDDELAEWNARQLTSADCG